LLGGASLPEREWDHANRRQQKKIKCASKKMRFDVWFSLFFSFLFMGFTEGNKGNEDFCCLGFGAEPLFTSLPSVKINVASALMFG
jgi:hypothetical protein